jgi:branched-chain amino acid transport system substrate-binding protein
MAARKYPDLRDVRVVADEHFAPTDVSVAAQIARIKSSGAQAVVAFVTGTPFATVLRAINDSGYEGTVVTGAGNAIKDQIIGYSAFLPRELIFGTLPSQIDVGIASRVRVQRTIYLDALKQITSDAPGVPQSVPWDPLTILVDGYRKIGFAATPNQMRDYILSVHDFAGIMGMYDFRNKDQRGLDPRSSGAMHWDKTTQNITVVSKPAGVPL